MPAVRVLVVGAGVGGLVAALELAAAGASVTVVEKAATVGGKMREVDVGGAMLDAGPTVFTMKWVFEALFEAVGTRLRDHVQLERATLLARHAWTDGGRLDLFADRRQSADAIAAFAGPQDARGYLEFAKRAGEIYATLESPFIRSACANPLALMRAVGARRLGELLRISPFQKLWPALGRYFKDPRLQQLFGRYATYCGSSPFLAPATLMLVAHVEQDGVWYIRGGMHRLACALRDVSISRGASFRFNETVTRIVSERGRTAGVVLGSGERVDADVVIVNADSAALAAGLFGEAGAKASPAVPGTARSLSAITWLLNATTSGFPLQRHNVFFSSDYAREFDDIFKHRRVPAQPTVYLCAQDRGIGDSDGRNAPERLMCLINAPPDGDVHRYTDAEIRSCEAQTFGLLEKCGLRIERTPAQMRIVTPMDFDRQFPGTGGALYGPASHGWKASFNRAASRSRLPGLYLAGGSVHPGPGVPMAALSGRLAAASVLTDFASMMR